jgi:hypothetical protein
MIRYRPARVLSREEAGVKAHLSPPRWSRERWQAGEPLAPWYKIGIGSSLHWLA